MSLDKAIKHGKEHRKPYRKAKAVDSSCRNHGGCPYCEGNRKHSNLKREESAKDQIKETQSILEERKIVDVSVCDDTVCPFTDVFEDGKRNVIQIEVPGVEPTSIKVECESISKLITVSGIIKETPHDSSTKFHLRQRRHGSFRRIFSGSFCGSEVDFDKIEFGYNNGVIEIVIPKSNGDNYETK